MPVAVSWDSCCNGPGSGRTFWVRGGPRVRGDDEDGRVAVVLAGLTAKSALVLGDYGLPRALIPGTGALLAMQHNGWDHALNVTADGAGLIGHAGAILLRKAADQAGLAAQLSAALRRKGRAPLFDRGIVLVSLAAAIALGAASMSDI